MTGLVIDDEVQRGEIDLTHPVSDYLPDTSRDEAARQAGPLARYASTIQSHRDDDNGKVLTIRERDLQSLAAVYDVQPDNLTEMLVGWGVLVAEPPGSCDGSG